MIGDYCPKCGQPSYMTGICLNNDCNFPNPKSNNALARERAEADRKKPVDEPIGKPPAAKGADWNWLAALVGAALGLGYAASTWGWKGGSLVAAAAIPGVLCGLFYKQIIGVLVIVGIGWAVLESRKEQSSTEAARIQEPAVLDQPAAKYSVVCVKNRTRHPVSYGFRWDGAGEWQEKVIEPGALSWHGYQQAGPADQSESKWLSVRFDGDLLAGFQPYTRKLGAVTRSGTGCDESVAFAMEQSGPRIGISNIMWIPGSPHPFLEGLVAADERDHWSAARGYTLTRSDTGWLAAREGDGFVGLTLGHVGSYADPQYEIIEVAANSSATNQGLQVGFRILEVEGKDVRTMTSNQLVSALRGPLGSSIEVRVLNKASNEIATVSLVRQAF